MNSFPNYPYSKSIPPLFPFYQGDVIQNLIRYLKYREININGKILTVIEVYPSSLQVEVIEDGQLKRYYLNSTTDKVQLPMTAQMFVVDYINNQKKMK